MYYCHDMIEKKNAFYGYGDDVKFVNVRF